MSADVMVGIGLFAVVVSLFYVNNKFARGDRQSENKKPPISQPNPVKTYANPLYVSLYDKLLYPAERLECELALIESELIQPYREAGKPIKLLDIGCGTGRLLKHLRRTYADTITAKGIDLSHAMVAHAQSRELDVEHANALQATVFSPGSFTHILVMFWVIYDIPQDKLGALFTNIVRWLKPNGTVCVQFIDRDTYILDSDSLFPAHNTARIYLDKHTYTASLDINQDTNVAAHHEVLTPTNGAPSYSHTHIMHIPPTAQVLETAKKCGLMVIRRIPLDDYDLESQELVIMRRG